MSNFVEFSTKNLHFLPTLPRSGASPDAMNSSFPVTSISMHFKEFFVPEFWFCFDGMVETKGKFNGMGESETP